MSAGRNQYNSEIKRSHDGRKVKMRLCRTCIKVNNREHQMKYSPPEKDLMVRDYVGEAPTKLAEEFILHQLEKYDLSDVTFYVTLRRINSYEGSVIVKPLIPVPPKTPKGRPKIKWRPWYEVGVQVRHSLIYPHTETRNVGSVMVTDKVAKAIMKEKWFYETADITFRDEAEAFVFGAGSGLFKALRAHIPKVVPGRASKVGMAAHGAKWLEEFREWRGAQQGEVMAYAV
jgi:hypothetical protein